MTKPLIEITQDAAAIISKNGETQGVYTDNITSCVIYALETDISYVAIHDSGQIIIKDIIDLFKENGKPRKLQTLWPTKATSHPGVIKKHQERYQKFRNILKLDEKNIKKYTAPFLTTYGAVFKKDAELTATQDIPSNVEFINEKKKRQAVIELNNNFSPLGKEALAIDVQYKNGAYQPPTKIIHSMDKIFDLIKEQKKFYAVNMHFLRNACSQGVLQLDESFLIAIAGNHPPENLDELIENARKNSFQQPVEFAYAAG